MQDPLRGNLRPKSSLGTVMTYFNSLWTGMTQLRKFKDRICILLFYLCTNTKRVILNGTTGESKSGYCHEASGRWAFSLDGYTEPRKGTTLLRQTDTNGQPIGPFSRRESCPCPVGICSPDRHPDLLEPAAARLRPKPPDDDDYGGGGASAPLISPTGMEGQAPPHLDAVVPEPLAVGDVLHPPRPVEVEDALPSVMDGLAPPLDGVARDPRTVSEELQPTGEAVEEDALPVAPGIVKGEVVVVEDVLPVATDIVNDASSEGPEAGSGGVVLTDELRDRIVKQVEYYFSDENLPTDEFLLKYVKNKKYTKAFVPIETIASFRRMKKLVQDLSVIEAALRTSSKLVVSSDGKRVRRLHPLPHNELKDSTKSTVLVENLPPDFSMESIQEKFGTVGKVVNITINDPELVKESSTAQKPNFNLSSKVHVLVEYEAVEAAKKAVTVLSDESNWRTGMKVRLLSKHITDLRSGKYNKPSKENQDAVSKKIDQNQHSKQDQCITSEKIPNADAVGSTKDKENLKSVLTTETEHHDQKPNSRGRKGRYKGQVQVQQNANKQGSSGSESLNKPFPGPRMPDGTRGFTLGRGRSFPLQIQKSEKAEE